MEPLVVYILIPILLVIGTVIGFIVSNYMGDKALMNAKKDVTKRLEVAEEKAEELRKTTLNEARAEASQIKQAAHTEANQRRQELKQTENKLFQREEMLDRRSGNLDRREENLERKEQSIEDRKRTLDDKHKRVDELVQEQNDKLIEISNYTIEQAQDIIMKRVEEDLQQEIAQYIKDEEDKAKDIAERQAKELISMAIQKYAQEVTSERTVSVVQLPSDDMKGRIIGREGRNIRAIESLTGVDLIIDDTPEAVVISGYDPIRRTVAKKTIEALVSDGRIHPGRIEEIVEKSRSEVDRYIRDKGEEAVFEVGIGRVHPDLVKLLGRLHFRTSYGQNVLRHSVECAFLAGKMAVELGEDEILARRAALMHDLGKAVDHEMEGSHVEIGAALAKKYKEPAEVIDGILSHHGDQAPESVIAVLVAAADTLSAARPGARSEAVDSYIKRLEQLEEITSKVEGVENSYAIQAGRELRVIVEPDKVTDAMAHKIARQIKEEIEENLSYPGTIKVTVIRETRAQDIAK
jgi:ribonuclease Y